MARYDADSKRRALRAFLAKEKVSVNRAAKASGMSESGLRSFLDGANNSLTDASYDKLALGLSNLLERAVTASELRGEALSNAPAGHIRISGAVGAGDSVFTVHQDAAIEHRPAPPGLSQPEGVVVRGDSMSPTFENGDILYFDADGSNGLPPEKAGRRPVIVRLDTGQTLVKCLARGKRKGLWNLLSINPSVATIEDQKVAWIAPIKWVERANG